MFCGSGDSGGSKSRLAKAVGAESSGQMRDKQLHAVVARSTCPSQECKKLKSSERFWSKKCTRLWREAHVEVKMYKTLQPWSTFKSCDVEKVDAVVARSTFQSECTKHTGSDHFWKLTCRKSAPRGGAKRISKSRISKSKVHGIWRVRSPF